MRCGPASMPSFYEFFAGGGMARAGLGPRWTCLFANDVDAAKARSYRANFGPCDELWVGDVREVAVELLPGTADLAWGSFPCQDLSLAGGGAGLDGARSGTFYAFWQVINGLAAQGRAPAVVALENVCGTLTARGGADFEAICRTFGEGGYRVGALMIDAELFTPQSRPRLFLVGVRANLTVPAALLAPAPEPPFHPTTLQRAAFRLPDGLRAELLWWRLPPPPPRTRVLADEIDIDGDWDDPTKTVRLLALMSGVNRAKVQAAMQAGRRMVGGVYRRTRTETGSRVQRAEVRFDGLSGCLRTPAGGSSRQSILVVEGPVVRSRLISPRESARLMGLSDHYVLPESANAAYHLTGDGVVASVVTHLARNIIEPLMDRSAARMAA